MNRPLLERCTKQIEALNLRERILLTLSAVAVLFLLMDLILLTPLSRLQEQVSLETTQWQGKLALLEMDAAQLGLSKNQGNFLSKMGYAQQLQTQVSAQETAIKTRLSTMIGPEQLPKVFADLLKNQGNLELSSLQSDVDDELINLTQLQQPSVDKNTPTGSVISSTDIAPSITRTNLSATYRGSYLYTQEFLNSLTSMPWALLWHQLTFEVTEYPDSTINLDAYTLGVGH